MKLVLVDNLLYDDFYMARKYDLQPHLGLLSLVAVARTAEHTAEIYSPKLDLVQGHLELGPALYNSMALRILERQPDAVGFTALGCNFNCVVKVARLVKRHRPQLPILLGGPHATILHREILETFGDFDIIARNEAENTLPTILAQLPALDFGVIPGVSYRTKDGTIICGPGNPIIEDLDELPMPAYDCYPLEDLKLQTIRVEAGRGCPFSCTFCSTASFFGRSYRLKSSGRLLKEMDHLHSEYGYTDFKLNHDLFTVNQKKVMEFCERVSDRNYTWSCSARVDCVDHDLIRMMSRAGCRSIFFGIESGSERMQSISRKRLDIKLVEPIIATTAELGISTVASFITGYPEEKLDDQNATLDFVGRLFCNRNIFTTAQLHLLTPEPGTQLMTDYGRQLKFDGYSTEFNVPIIEGDDVELLQHYPVIFPNHHYFPSALPRERHVFVTSAWSSLRLGGRVVVSYLLRSFERMLSIFLNDMYEWCVANKRERFDVTADDLIAFLRARFGDDHHVVSLFRYAVATRTLIEIADSTPQKVGGPKQFSDPRDNYFVLASNITILPDIHDCVRILESVDGIGGDDMLNNELAGPLGYLLIKAKQAPAQTFGSNNVSTYLINKSAADLLRSLAEPKSYWQYCSEIASETDIFPDWEDFELFWRAGIVELAGPATHAALIAAE